ncbi:MAG: tetratricopeptide repeat protein [Bacteroidetes bacterium]|nr:tetratricopeptide repeat protein [Bacteroidota bacterium]
MYLDEAILSEAWSDLEDAKRLAPRDPELYCLRSEYFLIAGNPKQAIKEAGTAIRLAPDAAMGYAAQATAFEAAGDLDHAKSDIDLAIQLEPEEYGFLASRAMILDAMGDRSAALKDLERYLSKDSLAWDAYLTRAWLMMRDTNWAAAESDLLAGLKIQPNETGISDQLGYLYILSKDFSKARQILAPLVQTSPNLAFAHANLGYAILKSGDTEAALKHVQQAIKLDEFEPRSFLYRAAIYHEMKKPTKACEDLQTAKDLGFIDFYGDSEYLALKKIACD